MSETTKTKIEHTSPQPSPQSGEGVPDRPAGKTTMKAVEAKFALVTQADAETEKAIESNVKTMRLAVNGARRSESLLYAYAAICGAAANRLAALVPPRGGLTKLLAAKFPEVSESQLLVWRNFAKDITPYLAITPMIGVINSPMVGKKLTIPSKQLEGFQTAIKQVLKGATMVEFHKASQFCGDVAPPGGDRGGSKGEKISDADVAEALRNEVRDHASKAADLNFDQKGLIHLMDDMREFTQIRMTYHDLNQTMLEMERKTKREAGL